MTERRGSKDLGIEQKLWSAADALRGSMDAGEYKNVVLGLIFLKFVSDAVGATDTDRTDSGSLFVVPPEAHWERIQSTKADEQLGRAMDGAMAALSASNETLRGALPETYSRPELNAARLRKVVDLISSIDFDNLFHDRDILGRVYEYFLLKFDMTYGSAAGEFYTPRDVVRLLVEMVQPYEGVVYDPCCGSGGMFVQSADFVQAHGRELEAVSIFGQEFNPTTWKLARMNLALKGIEADLGNQGADTFADDQHPELKADFIISNPPYNISSWFRREQDPRWTYGLPPAANSNYAWIQHIVHHLAPGGTAAVVLANGSLTTTSGGEDQIRERLVRDNIVDAIVTLPNQLFYTTSIGVCVWLLSRSRDGQEGQRRRDGAVLFIDARGLGSMVSRRNRELSEGDVDKIAATYNCWRGSGGRRYRDVLGFSRTVDVAEIEEHGFVLTPGRYVGIQATDQDQTLLDERISTLRLELAEHFAHGETIQRNLEQSLEALDHGS